MSKLKIYIDFDGTITRTDSLEYILNKHAGSNWQQIEEQVSRHQISEKEALQREFDLLKIDLPLALQELDAIGIDPYFAEFYNFCRAHHLPVTILSGGFEIFIRFILEKNGLEEIPFFANSVQVRNQRWTVIPAASPRIRNKCNHCKTYWLQQAKKQGCITVYIGDGNTDRCPAAAADVRFAKGNLAKYLRKVELSYYPFLHFNEVLEIFANKLDTISKTEKTSGKFQHHVAD